MIKPPRLVFHLIVWWKRIVNWRGEMLGCQCLDWSTINDSLPYEPETYSLPVPIPGWPPGQGFGSGIISLGELEVFRISKFEFVWSCNLHRDAKKGLAFYKPVEIPDGFHILGHCCQPTNLPFRGFLLVARELVTGNTHGNSHGKLPALVEPLDYALEWSLDDAIDEKFSGMGYFWLPQPPEGYKALGFLVTNEPKKPVLDEMRCVRADLTDKSELLCLILDFPRKVTNLPFRVWSSRPCHRGMFGKGVSVGTFYCSSFWDTEQEENLACLKNLDPVLTAMPNLNQIHALIKHYGPTVFFHPNEIYLPSSVSWFFGNGALLYKKGELTGEVIDPDGSNLPVGGSNDGEFWIDLPNDAGRNIVIHGNLESAKLYAHVKPAVGGTFTDIALWVFCPFNGPATLKLGVTSIAMSTIGQHVCDWEHFTLRICNFTGELWSIYFSQHSGGEWVDAPDLEYLEGNRAIVYCTRNGHASFPHPGTYLQGSSKLGLGIRNDAARSDLHVDSSIQYEIVAAEYLGDGAVAEPRWLQFMREWGPTIVYERNKVLPMSLRSSVDKIYNKLPNELSREEGPTGPKEKNNWEGDERW